MILAIVTVCVTIVVTYFLLNNEDYRWVCLAVWGASADSGPQKAEGGEGAEFS